MFDNNPKSAVVAVTYKCNSRCRMCGIWKKENVLELVPEDYGKLPLSLDDINITGGEPFLRPDIIEILDVIFKKINPSKLVISSNGFLSDIIAQRAQEIMKKPYFEKITIALSLDAIGSKHDEIRGISGAYEKVLKTIENLKKIGFKNIGIGFTFMAGNEDEYEKVYEFSRNNNLNFGATIAHNSSNYFSIDTNKKIDSKKVSDITAKYIKDNIDSMKPNELGKCYYMHGLSQYAENRRRIVPCNAGTGSFFMDPSGNIYPCNILNSKMGNINEHSFLEIWNGSECKKVRLGIKKCPCPCWMVCTAKPGIKKSWLKTGFWILKEKIRNYVK